MESGREGRKTLTLTAVPAHCALEGVMCHSFVAFSVLFQAFSVSGGDQPLHCCGVRCVLPSPSAAHALLLRVLAHTHTLTRVQRTLLSPNSQFLSLSRTSAPDSQESAVIPFCCSFIVLQSLSSSFLPSFLPSVSLSLSLSLPPSLTAGLSFSPSLFTVLLLQELPLSQCCCCSSLPGCPKPPRFHIGRCQVTWSAAVARPRTGETETESEPPAQRCVCVCARVRACVCVCV